MSTAGDGHVLHRAVSNLSLIALDCLFFLPDVRKGGRMRALLDIKICVDGNDQAMHLARTFRVYTYRQPHSDASALIVAV